VPAALAFVIFGAVECPPSVHTNTEMYSDSKKEKCFLHSFFLTVRIFFLGT